MSSEHPKTGILNVHRMYRIEIKKRRIKSTLDGLLIRVCPFAICR
ncbi:Uncharacterized protein APZ42_014863 [Daphnia magna]|uniref:Uncharacterized protein n=1 Tax=Daphnia magna TaxID=35525 RepID=A0A162NX20_9CRUS|nr:Uncharacterized protein APZ42_014863 [Daphnia magna]